MFSLQTNHLLLNEFKDDDLQNLIAIAKRMQRSASTIKGYRQFYAFDIDPGNPPDLIDSKVKEFLDKAKRERELNPRETYRLAIRFQGKLIGNVTIDMPMTSKPPELPGDLGVFIDPRYSRAGYAREACSFLIAEYFKRLQTVDAPTVLKVTTHPDNQFSRHLIEELGATAGPTKPSHYGHSEPRVIYTLPLKDFKPWTLREGQH